MTLKTFTADTHTYARIRHVESLPQSRGVLVYLDTIYGNLYLGKFMDQTTSSTWHLLDDHFLKGWHPKDRDYAASFVVKVSDLLNLFHCLLKDLDEWCNPTFLLEWWVGMEKSDERLAFETVMHRNPNGLVSKLLGYKEFLVELDEWNMFLSEDFNQVVQAALRERLPVLTEKRHDGRADK